MAIALEQKGTMRLEQVMAPAIELADGFPMYEFLRNFFVSERKATEQYEWSTKTYYPDGRIPEVGEIFRQPNLARDAARDRRRRAGGVREDATTASPPSAPGATPSTRATSRAASRRPTARPAASSPTRTSRPTTDASRSRSTTNFHGYDVYKAGPWDQGPVLLQTLNILEGVDLKAMGAELRRLHPHGARGDQARLRRPQRVLRRSRRSRRCR